MKFKLTIDGREIPVDSTHFPFGDNGRPGSLLDIALGNGYRIHHTCGGVCSCTTCHVLVKRGMESCSKPNRAERDRLQEVYGRTSESRLACQCVPNGLQDIEIEIP